MDLSTTDWEVLKLMWETATANPSLKARLQAEFERRIAGNTKYSREYFYSVCRIGKRNMTVYFIPTTRAYALYGPSAMVDLLPDEAELARYAANYAAKTSTFGTVLAIPRARSAFSDAQIQALATEGFQSQDVYKVVF